MKIKNDKDARKFAEKILTEKYGTHKIDATLHATGANDWEVKAYTEELNITLFLDQETGELLIEPQILREVKREIIEPPISVKDKIFRTLKHEYEEAHWGWLIATVGLTVIGAVLSAFFDPLTGITLSLIFGGLSIWYGKHAFTRYKIIDRG